MPVKPQLAHLAPPDLSAEALFDRFGMGGQVGGDGAASFEDGDRAFSRSADGSFSVRLAHPNLDNHHAPSASTASTAWPTSLSTAWRCAATPS